MADELYDAIGATYATVRRTEPRIAAQLDAALGDARTVLNVGAGTGSYEPAGREVLAVEPSAVMRRQRPPHAAPVIAARAEALPFPDRSFDATMATFSDHHWTDRVTGLHELRRVARDRAVLLTWDGSYAGRYWLIRDYFPSFAALAVMTLEEVAKQLRATTVEVVPIPHDCVDGFLLAYWRRPQALLDPAARDGISCFARLEPAAIADGIGRLSDDIASGAWAERNAELLELEELDLGLRLLVATKRHA